MLPACSKSPELKGSLYQGRKNEDFCMLLAIDISNTNIKFGLYNSETMKHHWVVSTARQRTTDEYAMLLSELTHHTGYHFSDIDDIILSSVVPPLTPCLSSTGSALLRQRGACSRSYPGPVNTTP